MRQVSESPTSGPAAVRGLPTPGAVAGIGHGAALAESRVWAVGGSIGDVDSAQKREIGAWWAPQVLLFTQVEMRRFLKSVRTVAGHPDRMFGFAFNDPTEVVQVRGDSKRRFKDFRHHLLGARVSILRRFLTTNR